MTLKTTMSVLIAIILLPIVAGDAFAETDTPYKQFKNGVPIEEIQCREDRVLVIRDNEKAACVKEKTAEKRDWKIIAHTFETVLADNAKESVDTIIDISKGTEISTNRITVVGGVTTQSDTEFIAVPIDPNQPWTTLTYPEEFRIGEPFTINYTWTFLKYYSEANGDEWPQDNLEKYPWAQHWQPYQEGEDENGKDWWTIKRGNEYSKGTLVKIFGDDALKLFTEGFTVHDWKGEPHFPPLEDKLEKELTHPWDLEEHSASITLQFDEPINPPNHRYSIKVGTNDVYSFYVHFDGNKGYIGTEYMKWFTSNTPSASALAEEDLSNPYVCWTDERWNHFSDERKRWEYAWPSTDCVGKSRPSSNTGIPPSIEEQIETSVIGWKDWIDRNGITENIQDYLENTLGVPSNEVERFFEKYPHLKGLFILPSFSFLPDAFATHGNDHLLVARGTFLVSDLHGNPISPIGSSVCIYDQRDDGSFNVLKNGNKDACKIMIDSTGT